MKGHAKVPRHTTLEPHMITHRHTHTHILYYSVLGEGHEGISKGPGIAPLRLCCSKLRLNVDVQRIHPHLHAVSAAVTYMATCIQLYVPLYNYMYMW